MVVAQALAVVCGTEKASEMPVKLTGLEKIDKCFGIVVHVLMPAPKCWFFMYVLMLTMQVKTRQQQAAKGRKRPKCF
jgi:hypothetical protein